MSKRSETDSSDRRKDASKKLKVVEEKYREWSSVAETSDEPITHYTIKVYHGDPDQKLPAALTQAKKEDLINHLVKSHGFKREDCVGTKGQLLHSLQRNRPFVTMKIDGREGLQRVLSTALYQFGWSCDHMYTAKLPSRGTSTIGTQTYQDILVPEDYTITQRFTDQQYREFIDRSHNRMNKKINSEFVHLVQSERDAMFKDICNFTIRRLDIAPMRTFTGFALELDNKMDCDMFDEERANQTFCLSLNELALRAGDRIHYRYDRSSTFIAEILECKQNQPLLPEILGDRICRNVRARVVGESANKITRQYPVNSFRPQYEDNFEDEEEEEDGSSDFHDDSVDDEEDDEEEDDDNEEEDDDEEEDEEDGSD